MRVPGVWVAYLAAFDALVAASARGDDELADAARVMMGYLFEEMKPERMDPTPAAVRISRHRYVDVEEAIAFLLARG